MAIPPRSAQKWRCPDSQVVDIDGDGSFLMNVQELATAHIEKIAAKAMILNNQHLGMVMQWEDKFFEGNRGHTYLGDPENRKQIYPDYIAMAKSFNVPCERVMYKKDLRARHATNAGFRSAVRARCDRALYRACAAFYSRRENRRGHDLEALRAGCQ